MEDVPHEVERETENNATENVYHGANGRFAKGNPGKPPGSSKNKLRDQVKGFLSDNWVDLPEFFKELTPKEKWQVVIDLLPYVVPRLKHTDITFEPSQDEQQILREEIAKGFDRLFNGTDNSKETA